MEKETFIQNHRRTCSRISGTIDRMTERARLAIDPVAYYIIEAKVDVLRSLGFNLKAVAELEAKLAALKAEIFGKEAA